MDWLFLNLCRFDKRITVFAEEKFQRDGIDLKTGSLVTKVSDKEISTKERATGQNVSIPYGMVVWSTGIGTRPVIMDFMKQIGQVCFFKWFILILNFHENLYSWTCFKPSSLLSLGKQTNRRVLATDEWLRVEKCDSIYALGDCATINQRKVMVYIFQIYPYDSRYLWIRVLIYVNAHILQFWYNHSLRSLMSITLNTITKVC